MSDMSFASTRLLIGMTTPEAVCPADLTALRNAFATGTWSEVCLPICNALTQIDLARERLSTTCDDAQRRHDTAKSGDGAFVATHFVNEIGRQAWLVAQTFERVIASAVTFGAFRKSVDLQSYGGFAMKTHVLQQLAAWLKKFLDVQATTRQSGAVVSEKMMEHKNAILGSGRHWNTYRYLDVQSDIASCYTRFQHSFVKVNMKDLSDEVNSMHGHDYIIDLVYKQVESVLDWLTQLQQLLQHILFRLPIQC